MFKSNINSMYLNVNFVSSQAVLQQLSVSVPVTSYKISLSDTMKQTLSVRGALDVLFWMLFISFCTFDARDSPQFVCNSTEPRWAGGWDSGFSPGSGGVGRRFRQASSFILTQVKFPSEDEKRNEMNKRLILTWKTLAHCEPDSGRKVPRFESSAGGFCAHQEMLVKCGEFIWGLPGYEMVQDCTEWKKKFFFYPITLGTVKESSEATV